MWCLVVLACRFWVMSTVFLGRWIEESEITRWEWTVIINFYCILGRFVTLLQHLCLVSSQSPPLPSSTLLRMRILHSLIMYFKFRILHAYAYVIKIKWIKLLNKSCLWFNYITNHAVFRIIHIMVSLQKYVLMYQKFYEFPPLEIMLGTIRMWCDMQHKWI